MLRVILAIIIASHGIGHVLFLVPLMGNATWGQSTQSWLIGGGTPARLIGGFVWAAALIIFCIAVFGLLTEQDWWRNAAIIAAAASALGLLLFWATPPSSSVIFALAVDLIIVVALLLFHFPSVESVGA